MLFDLVYSQHLFLSFFFDSILHPEINDLGYLPIPTRRIDVPEGMRIAVQVIGAITLAIFMALLSAVVYFRNKNVIRYSSPVFSFFSLTGASMMIVTVFLLSPQPPTQGTCISAYWLLCVGFGLFYAGILVKTWRIIVVIRGASVFKAVSVPVRSLLAMITVIVLIEIILLILYSTIDTPDVVMRTPDDDVTLGLYEFRMVCQYPGASSVILWVLVAYNGLILAAGVVLTFMTKDISKIFNESKHLAVGIYAFGFALAIIVPLIEITSDVSARYLITCLGIIVSTATAVFSLFLPKFWVIYRGGDASYDPSSQPANSLFSGVGSMGGQRSTMVNTTAGEKTTAGEMGENSVK